MPWLNNLGKTLKNLSDGIKMVSDGLHIIDESLQELNLTEKRVARDPPASSVKIEVIEEEEPPVTASPASPAKRGEVNHTWRKMD